MCNEIEDRMKNNNLMKINHMKRVMYTNIVANNVFEWDLIDPFQPKEVYQHLFMDST